MVGGSVPRNSNWAYGASSSPVWHCSTDIAPDVFAAVAVVGTVVAVAETVAVVAVVGPRCTVGS